MADEMKDYMGGAALVVVYGLAGDLYLGVHTDLMTGVQVALPQRPAGQRFGRRHQRAPVWCAVWVVLIALL